MEKIIRTAAAMALVVVLLVPVMATAAQFFPDSRVEAQLFGTQAAYLGLSDTATSFRFSDIKTEYLLIDVYSLYCSPCQRDAAAINEMYDKVAAMGLSGRIKFIGLAAGNTEMETAYWRNRFNVQFPLIPDADYVLHTTLGGVGTPFFVLVRVDGPDRLTVLFSQEGAFDDKDAFFAMILALTTEAVAASK